MKTKTLGYNESVHKSKNKNSTIETIIKEFRELPRIMKPVMIFAFLSPFLAIYIYFRNTEVDTNGKRLAIEQGPSMQGRAGTALINEMPNFFNLWIFMGVIMLLIIIASKIIKKFNLET